MADDRTSEFMALARSLPQERINNNSYDTSAPAAAGRYRANDPAYTELRTFHETASGISKDIAATSHMLAELTQLVKSSNNLFTDDSQQVNALVMRIKQNIENLNGRLDQANASIQYQKRHLGSQAGQEASNLVVQLKEEFVQATAGFKKVLQQRTDNMKEASDQKMQVYGGAVDFVSLDNKPIVYGDSKVAMGTGFPTLDLTSGMSAGEPSGSTLPRPHGAIGDIGGSYKTPDLRMRRASTDIPVYSGGVSSYHARSDSMPLTPLDIQRMEQETGLQMQLIPDQSYLRDRADAMSTVESNIVELGTIFNKLAVMVSEHREMVQRVEDNVEEANSNLTMSMNVLTDTLTSLKTNRALMAKVFGVFVLFIIAFIIFFA
ncbi:Helical region in SNARE [Fragilaria crotonensis]|nr:Helical region in SNARE [Fragilaria crotonensis]